MEIISAIMLGIVQGFTEFLPLSFSGHLLLAARYLNFEQPGVVFEATLHVGTTFAVVWYLREKLFNLSLGDIKLIVIATIPSAIIGVLFREELESLFSLIKLTGFAFLVSAFMSYQVDKQKGKREQIDFIDALVVGVFQAFAIIPAISRPGATIFGATRMNLSKEKAAEFSFLISIPAVLGANFVEFLSQGGDTNFSPALAIIGAITAFISGTIAIKFLLKMLVQNRFKIFSYYLIVLGVITILFL